jgi:hypothetical protein
MTSQQDLIKVIEENVSTVDKNAEGFFSMEEYVKNDFTMRPDYMIRGNSVTLYSDNVTSLMRLYSPIGLNEER